MYIFQFADDGILIFSNSLEELKDKLNDLAETRINVGLKINLENTKVICSSFAQIYFMSIATLRLRKCRVMCFLDRK